MNAHHFFCIVPGVVVAVGSFHARDFLPAPDRCVCVRRQGGMLDRFMLMDLNADGERDIFTIDLPSSDGR